MQSYDLRDDAEYIGVEDLQKYLRKTEQELWSVVQQGLCDKYGLLTLQQLKGLKTKHEMSVGNTTGMQNILKF